MMLAIKILAAIALVLFLLSLLRLGIRIEYGVGLCVDLCVGPIRRAVYPKKAANKPKAEGTTPAQSVSEKKKRFTKPELSREEWRELLRLGYHTLCRTLRRTCRRLRIDPLEVAVIFGGSDPAAVATNFGRANAILWNVMPKLEELFHIPDPAIHLGMDYTAEKKVTAEGEIGLSLRICDLLLILLTLLIPLLKWYRQYKHRHPKAPTAPAEPKQEITERASNETLSA